MAADKAVFLDKCCKFSHRSSMKLTPVSIDCANIQYLPVFGIDLCVKEYD